MHNIDNVKKVNCNNFYSLVSTRVLTCVVYYTIKKSSILVDGLKN